MGDEIFIRLNYLSWNPACR